MYFALDPDTLTAVALVAGSFLAIPAAMLGAKLLRIPALLGLVRGHTPVTLFEQVAALLCLAGAAALLLGLMPAAAFLDPLLACLTAVCIFGAFVLAVRRTALTGSAAASAAPAASDSRPAQEARRAA